ncbi:MAG TPA: 7-carboxy-7-deazaguanine synthase QueE, partial [Dokdonella sp.]|nr:7-carboxy-7-deazaguanine synthase QueE [Dokdonella sp.]
MIAAAAHAESPVEPTASLRLRITEIFHSLQGESDSMGWPTVFIRLTG